MTGQDKKALKTHCCCIRQEISTVWKSVLSGDCSPATGEAERKSLWAYVIDKVDNDKK